jgi:prephenate dehydrogenase
MKTDFNIMAVYGIGLLGGSLCRRVRRFFPSVRIMAADMDRQSLESALNEGVIDEIINGGDSTPAGADLVVVAVPVMASIGIIRDILSAHDLKSETIVIDVGSVKGPVVASVSGSPGSARFVGCNPMAGTERSGYAAGFDALYDNARVIITPHAANTEKTLELVMNFWQSMETEVHIMDPDRHDMIAAMTSHLPDLMSGLLVSIVKNSDFVSSMNDVRKMTGTGFTGMTRLAASSPEMWSDIAALNARNILPLLDRCVEEINRMKKMVGEASEDGRLREYLDEVRNFREKLVLK